MKKRTAILIPLFFLASLSFKDQSPPTERTYKLEIPDHLIQPFYSLINGASIDNLTVGQMKELTKVVNEQIQPQYRKYFLEDSTAQAQIKKDTTHKK